MPNYNTNPLGIHGQQFYSKMMDSRESVSFSESPEMKEIRKNMLNPEYRPILINFREKRFSADIQPDSKEADKLRDFLEDTHKDSVRYNQYKDVLKRRFFNIRVANTRKLNTPHKLDLDLSKLTYRRSPSNSLTFTDRRHITSREGYYDQFQRFLDVSHSLASPSPKNKKVVTGSQIRRKSKGVIQNEKKLIMKFIKKSQSVDMGERKWEDLTPGDKYIMQFSHYMKKKTQSEIDKEVYQKKIQKKTTQLDKFQDFILDEVKFSNQNKEKLEHFFKGIRSEFKRVQSHR